VKTYSIKKRLISSVLLVELVAAVAISSLAFIYEQRTHFRAFDIMLRGRADSLLGAVQDAEDAQDNVMLDGSEANLPKRDIYEVWDQNNSVLGKSQNWDGLDPNQLGPPGGRPNLLRQSKKQYRFIRVDGVRNVDPGDHGGGLPRRIVIVYGSPTAPVWHAIWTAVEFYALSSVLLLGLTGLLMFRLLNDSLAPLNELASEAASVSTTSWSFRPSEHVMRIAELAPLAGALDTALKGLEHSFTQQRRFVGDAAHELKTAVAVVKSSLQLLMMKPRTVAEYQAGLERCQLDCERMQNIVTEMLTLARLEDEAARHAGESVAVTADCTQVVQQVADQFRSLAEMKRVRISITAPASLMLKIEGQQLHLMCSNVLLNALQHSHSGSEVRVSLDEAEGWAEIRTIDSGTGVDPDLLPHIFERFYRGDPSRSRRTGGTGLGLAICQAIVQKFKGSIQITSEVSKGTAVLVRLPLAPKIIPDAPQAHGNSNLRTSSV
jgi:signal transduction histidine kinase